MVNDLFDLLYFDEDRVEYEKAKTAVRERFPFFILTDESDDIKGIRLGIKFPEEEKEIYYTWILSQGLGTVSLHVQLMIYKDQETLLGYIRQVAGKGKE